MQRLQDLPTRAIWFIVAVAVAGAGATATATLLDPVPMEIGAFLFIVMTAAAGLVKVPLPVVGSLSLGHAFILATLMGFGPGASTLAALLSALTSEAVSWARVRRPPLHRTAFNAGVATLSASISAWMYVGLNGPVGSVDLTWNLLAVLPYTLAFMFLNLGLISLVIQMTRGSGAAASLRANFGWSVPGYLAGSSLAILLRMLYANGNVATLALAAPFAYLVHHSYRARTDKVEEEKRHSQQTAELYFGIIRALALAVETKDENTEEHLRRVERYSVGVAELLGLDAKEIEALRASALLHDIGKLGIPEYILTKPGRLTAEEMDCMRQHPEIGADILAAVPFPFPMAPVVRHHHERWDGAGYPDGLKGEAIPLGARILSAVDCFDAITSDRPYRRGIAREEAFRYMQGEAGKMFDPRIVDLLVEHADEMEAGVSRSGPGGARPASPVGAIRTGTVSQMKQSRVRSAEAGGSRLEKEILADVARVVALDLSPEDRLCLVSVKLGSLIRHRTVVVYRPDLDAKHLVAAHAVGIAAGKILGHSIAMGERMSGWAAQQRKPYAGRSHRDPLGRDGSRSDLEEFASDPELSALDYGIVSPIADAHGLVGVLALYGDERYGDSDEDVLRRVVRVAELIARFLPRDGTTAANLVYPPQSWPA